MYIQPNSTIKLLHNVPIDPNQTDTLYFDSLSSQLSYFNSKVVATFPLNTYQRVNKGACRINALADTLYDVNYMMFQNTNYSNKWFYAFVDNVEYINDNTTEITFTIDSIQTWFFNYTTEECFVERETTISDEIGEHIEGEDVGTGEYVTNGDYSDVGGLFRDQCIIVAYLPPSTELVPELTFVELYDGVMGACNLLAYDATEVGVRGVRDFIASKKQHPDSIVNIYMCPKALIGTVGDNHLIPPTATGVKVEAFKNAITTNDTLDGYKPRNNKMYTYPYNFYHVDTPSGQSLITRYEFFENLQPTFEITGNITTPVELACIPSAYKNTRPSGSLANAEEYRPERLSIKGFPICNWSVDYYSSWLAQNSVPIATNIGASALTSMAMGNPIPLGTNTLAQASRILNDHYRASIHADVSKGSLHTGSNDFSNNRMYFKGCRMSVSHQIAKRIDDYFTAFGYNVGVLKAPNRNQRTRFTYVKTIGCNVSGSLPSSDAKYIADCYDRGIRFWKDHSHVCDYTADNLPLE